MSSKDSKKILVKSEEESNPEYGRIPEERPIEEYIRKGIANIDKPSGPTSHQVSAWVKDIFGFKRSGHSGTLDPKVTGVLPVALEDSTRVLQALLLSSKEYVCLMKLHSDVNSSELKKMLSYFQGELYQKPPLKSSVKRELRKRTVYSIKLLEREEVNVLFSVECEAGTYIRKLCHDIGLMLGVGAHMQELRRTKAGPFTEDTIVTLHDLRDAYQYYVEDGSEDKLRQVVQPMEAGVRHLKRIWVKDSAVDAVCHGASLNSPGVSKLEEDISPGEVVALMTLKQELIALAKAKKTSLDIMESPKGEVAAPGTVVMKTDIYPRQWHSKNI
ncbi:MAG: RNA-guided pseudouridylation complex pseudouridine synthase subunit Cbf5 [Candidatus Altiarchaeota archaeon]